MSFDPAFDRQSLEEWVVKHARELSYDEAVQKHLLDSYGSSILTTGLECLLVGFMDIGMELAQRARVFLRAAIEDKHLGGPGALDLVLGDFVLSVWLIDGRLDLESLKKATYDREAWFEEHGSDQLNVQLCLPNYLNAEEYDALFHRFEAARIKPPKNLRSIKGEGTMSYALARHRLGLEYSAEEIAAALNTFFKRNMRPHWLDRGQYQTVAKWMQIAYWKPGDDPIATCLKCYDFLPDFERPAYP